MRLAPVAVAALAIFAGYKLYTSGNQPRARRAGGGRSRATRHRVRRRHRTRRVSPASRAPKFSATVRVLRREDYSMGPLAKLVPTDFAVGWGPMSDSAVLADVEISQGNRFCVLAYGTGR
jgi:hypothetical protein